MDNALTAVTNMRIDTMHAALNAVRRFASPDTTRPTLNAILLDWSGDRLLVVATDGRALARYTVPEQAHTGRYVLTLSDAETLRKTLKIHIKSDVSLDIRASDAGIRFSADGLFEAEFKTSDVPFPPYESIIPKVAYKKDSPHSVSMAGGHLSDVCAAFGGSRSYLTVSTQGERDPVIITGSKASSHNPLRAFDPTRLFIIVMPVRL